MNCSQYVDKEFTVQDRKAICISKLERFFGDLTNLEIFEFESDMLTVILMAIIFALEKHGRLDLLPAEVHADQFDAKTGFPLDLLTKLKNFVANSGLAHYGSSPFEDSDYALIFLIMTSLGIASKVIILNPYRDEGHPEHCQILSFEKEGQHVTNANDVLFFWICGGKLTLLEPIAPEDQNQRSYQNGLFTSINMV